jgi:predicted DNA-binding protein (MmcQ/YjbR family)
VSFVGGESRVIAPTDDTNVGGRDESERTALQADERFFYAAYLGPSCWLGLDFAVATVEWTEVRELVDASYRLVAPKKSVELLDGR